MNLFSCAWLALALAGMPGAPAPAGPATILVADSLDDLKSDVAAASKEGMLSEAQAVEFTTRAAKLAKTADKAEERIDILKMVHGLRFRGTTDQLDKLRGEVWDVVIEHDANEAELVAPLISRYLTDEQRAATLGKRSKASEVKAACAFIPLNNQFKRTDRSEKESKQLIEGLHGFQKQFGAVVDPARKKPWSEACESVLFQAEHLAIGSEVPEIESNDTAGVKFKLSDYRGKVVLLDFWGNW